MIKRKHETKNIKQVELCDAFDKYRQKVLSIMHGLVMGMHANSKSTTIH